MLAAFVDEKVVGDYGILLDTMVVYCDKSHVIDISKNPVQHSRTKHREIRYYFIRDLGERKIVVLEYIPTEHQNAHIFTKPFNRSIFEPLCQVIGVITFPKVFLNIMVLMLNLSIFRTKMLSFRFFIFYFLFFF